MRRVKRSSFPEMTELLTSTNQTVAATNQLLISLKMASLRMKSDGISGTQEVMVFESIMNSLETLYHASSDKYKAMQQKYKSDIEKKILDEVLIRRPAATNNEVISALNGVDALCYINNANQEPLPVASIYQPVIATSTANIVESVKLNYPDLETLNKSLFDLNQSSDDFCVLAQSVDARPIEAIGTRPLLSQDDQGEVVVNGELLDGQVVATEQPLGVEVLPDDPGPEPLVSQVLCCIYIVGVFGIVFVVPFLAGLGVF